MRGWSNVSGNRRQPVVPAPTSHARQHPTCPETFDHPRPLLSTVLDHTYTAQCMGSRGRRAHNLLSISRPSLPLPLSLSLGTGVDLWFPPQHRTRVSTQRAQSHSTTPAPFCPLFLIAYPYIAQCIGASGHRARNLSSLSRPSLPLSGNGRQPVVPAPASHARPRPHGAPETAGVPRSASN